MVVTILGAGTARAELTVVAVCVDSGELDFRFQNGLFSGWLAK
jgi:hypothetical protein